MPIVALRCPRCLMDVDVGHFRTCDAVPLGMAIYAASMQSGRPVGWTVTQLLGCIREHAIMTYLPVTVNPARVMSLMTGQAVHRLLEELAPAPEKRRYYGVIRGLSLSGEFDDFDEATQTVTDYKWTGSLWNLKAPKPEHIVQVSLYAELMRQSGVQVDKWRIVYGGFGDTPLVFTGKPIILDACLAHRIEPNTSVADNIEIAKRFDETLDVVHAENELAMRSLIGFLPCTCKSIMYGKVCKADAYCTAAEVCRSLDGIPF